ncbi:MAG: hypothetical protein IPG72_00800 [Ardenticatenales bacterium]|jgi:hypothetical protein|nr:hypothetical protein [Ardenticatenales bacterium]
MSTSFRGIGSETGALVLIVLGVAGFILAPADVARLLTIVVIGYGFRDLFAPYDGRSPSIFVLVIGIWSAISAYGIWRFDFLNSWPLLVTLVGLALIFQAIVDGRRGDGAPWRVSTSPAQGDS